MKAHFAAFSLLMIVLISGCVNQEVTGNVVLNESINASSNETSIQKEEVKLECSKDSNCGKNDFVEEAYCNGNSIYQKFIIFSCINSMCLNTTQERLKQTCSPIQYSNWSYYCYGSNLMRERSTTENQCGNAKCVDVNLTESETVKTCTNGCDTGKCVGESVTQSIAADITTNPQTQSHPSQNNQTQNNYQSPSPQPIQTSDVKISVMQFDAPGNDNANLNEEWIEIKNFGTASADLSGWTLSDAGSHTYTFPSFTLATGSNVKVRTGSGTNTQTDLYWSRSSAVWNNSGDTATLKDNNGNIVDQKSD